MPSKFIEETVLVLEDLKVGIGVLKRFYSCTDGVLTTFRLSFNYTNNKPKNIFVSSITSVKISNSFYQEYLVLQSGAIRYFISCSDNEKLYSELLRVVKFNETNTVLNSPRSVGGISRVVKAQKEKLKSAESVRSCASELKALKKKSKVVKDVLLKVGRYDQEGFTSSIDAIFKSLGVDLSSLSQDTCEGDTHEQLKNILSVLLEKNEAILLHEFFCAANRLMLTNLLSPTQFVGHVNRLEKEGLCKLHKVKGIYILTRSSCSNLKDEFFKDLNKILKRGPTDILSFSRSAKISTSLAQVKLNIAEQMGLVVRDESLDKTTFYYNYFK